MYTLPIERAHNFYKGFAGMATLAEQIEEDAKKYTPLVHKTADDWQFSVQAISREVFEAETDRLDRLTDQIEEQTRTLEEINRLIKAHADLRRERADLETEIGHVWRAIHEYSDMSPAAKDGLTRQHKDAADAEQSRKALLDEQYAERERIKEAAALRRAKQAAKNARADGSGTTITMADLRDRFTFRPDQRASLTVGGLGAPLKAIPTQDLFLKVIKLFFADSSAGLSPVRDYLTGDDGSGGVQLGLFARVLFLWLSKNRDTYRTEAEAYFAPGSGKGTSLDAESTKRLMPALNRFATSLGLPTHGREYEMGVEVMIPRSWFAQIYAKIYPDPSNRPAGLHL